MTEEPPPASTWGMQTSSFFDNTTTEQRSSPSHHHHHHRSLSAFVTGSYIKDVQATALLKDPSSSAAAATGNNAPLPTKNWQNDQEYYEWVASHPTSPLLSPCQDVALFHVEHRFDHGHHHHHHHHQTSCGGDVVQVDTKQIIAEGQHSLLFLCTIDPGIVCKCAKSDKESMESVGRESKVYTWILDKQKESSSACLMRPIAIGSLTVRNVVRPAILLPRALGSLDEQGLLTISGLQVAKALFEGLQELHALGIIHGDIKPHNVFNFGNSVQIGDFGAVCFVDDNANQGRCGSGGAPGTLPYQAPEQIASSQPSFKSDVYSAGVTMWSILTKKQPFALYTSSVLMMLAIRNQPFVSNNQEPQASPIWQCIKDCVHRDPEKRPTAAAVVARLCELGV